MYDAPHSASQSNGNYSYDRTSDVRFDRKSADAHPVREPEDSMLSSRTRSLLDKVKESTAALSNMNNFDEFDQKPSSRRYYLVKILFCFHGKIFYIYVVLISRKNLLSDTSTRNLMKILLVLRQAENHPDFSNGIQSINNHLQLKYHLLMGKIHVF